MSAMLQRVGAAILEAESQWTPKGPVSKERAMALAALEALREPSQTMLDAGPPEPYMDAEVWAKMIDAALTPPE